MDYQEKLRLAKEALASGSYDKETIEHIFPELKESEDEKIRKVLIKGFQHYDKECKRGEFTTTEILSWLEKQGQETSWKPSKEEMDVLYGLSYITNKFDERKEEVIMRLYQDLKREFFNGASFENMFPTNISHYKFTFDDVLALQCAMGVAKKVQKDEDLYERLESLHNRVHDAYWLEKQGEQKTADNVE